MFMNNRPHSDSKDSKQGDLREYLMLSFLSQSVSYIAKAKNEPIMAKVSFCFNFVTKKLAILYFHCLQNDKVIKFDQFVS